MATLGQVFNKKDLPSDAGMPAGWHTVMITNCELKTAKSGGKYLRFLFTNKEGLVNSMINIENPNPVAVDIGMKTLRNLMTAVGIETLSDTDQFLNKTLKIEVAIKEDSTYGMQSEVKKYASVSAKTTQSAPAGVAYQDPEPVNDLDDVIPF